MSLITDPLLYGAETPEQTARVIRMLEDGGPKYSRAWYTYDSTKFLLRRALQATLHAAPDVWRKPESTHWVVPTYDFDRRMPHHVTSGVFDASKWTWSRKYSGSRLWGLARSTNDGTLWLRYEAWSAVSEEDAKHSGIVHIHKYTHVKVDPGVRVILSDEFMHSVLDRAERYGVCQPRSATEPEFYQHRLPACISVVEAQTKRCGGLSQIRVSGCERYVYVWNEEDIEERSEMTAEELQIRDVSLAGLSEAVHASYGTLKALGVCRGSVSRRVCIYSSDLKMRTRLGRIASSFGEVYGLPLSDEVEYIAAVRLTERMSNLRVRDLRAKPLEVWGELYQPVSMDVDGAVVWENAREQVLADWYEGCGPEVTGGADAGWADDPSVSAYTSSTLFAGDGFFRYGHGDDEDDASTDDGFERGLHFFQSGRDWARPGDPIGNEGEEEDDEEIARHTYHHPGEGISAGEYRMIGDWITSRPDGHEVPEMSLLGKELGGDEEELLSKWSSMHECVVVDARAREFEPYDAGSTAWSEKSPAGKSCAGHAEDSSTVATSLISDGSDASSDGSDDAWENQEGDAWQASFWGQTESDGLRIQPVCDLLPDKAFQSLRAQTASIVDGQIAVVSGADASDTRFKRAREMYVDFLLRGDMRYEAVWPIFVDSRAFRIFVRTAGEFPYEPGLVNRMLMKVDIANANLWSRLLTHKEDMVG